MPYCEELFSACAILLVRDLEVFFSSVLNECENAKHFMHIYYVFQISSVAYPLVGGHIDFSVVLFTFNICASVAQWFLSSL